MPSTPGTPWAIASRVAVIARCMTAASSLINVGRKPVVPNRRCARPIAAIASTEVSLLNSTPPPPLTWASMKPGTRQSPCRSMASPPGGAPCSTATMKPSSTTTHTSRSKPRSVSTCPLWKTWVVMSDGLGDLVEVRRYVGIMPARDRERIRRAIERLHGEDRRAGRMRRPRQRQHAGAAGAGSGEPDRGATRQELLGDRGGTCADVVVLREHQHREVRADDRHRSVLYLRRRERFRVQAAGLLELQCGFLRAGQPKAAAEHEQVIGEPQAGHQWRPVLRPRCTHCVG